MDLNRAKNIRKEIASLEYQLEELRSQAESITQNLTGMPHTGRISDKTGEKVPVLVDLQRRLKTKVDKLESELIVIEGEIALIKEPLARTVGREKYLMGKTWKEIADKQGFATDTSCRQFFWYHWCKTFRHGTT